MTVSFAWVQPEQFQSTMIEPVPEYSYQNGIYKYKFFWIVYCNVIPSSGTSHYFVVQAEMSSADQIVGFETPYWFKSNSQFHADISVFNADSGNFYRSESYDSQYNSYRGYYQGNLRFNLTNSTDGYYYIAPEQLTVPSGSVEPFILWSANVPDQTSYKSPLSEPVSDEYNSYVVLDDKLIWISYRVNSIYTRSSNIENASEIYSSIAQVEESGTGSYAGQQNGYTEEIVLPSQNYSGSSTGSTEDITLSDNQNGYGGNYSGTDPDHSSSSFYTGAWYYANQNLGSVNFSGNHSGVIQGASLGNIDFSGVNSGNVHFNSSGTVTLNDKEYYPISFSQTDIQKFYRLYLLPVSSDNFVFWLAPDRSFSNVLNDEIVINMDFFYSEFDLNGNYIRSTFHTVTDTDIGLFDAYQPEEDVSSVRCYGIDFYNINNIPLNLSSVLWQYDFEFSAWRDSMLNMLTSIYNALTSDSNVPEAPTTANWGQEVNDMEPTSTISNDEVISIYDNVGEINSSLNDSSDSLHSLVDMFSIGKLIGLVAFALSIGTAILILGKKKSE